MFRATRFILFLIRFISFFFGSADQHALGIVRTQPPASRCIDDDYRAGSIYRSPHFLFLTLS